MRQQRTRCELFPLIPGPVAWTSFRYNQAMLFLKPDQIGIAENRM